MDHGIQPDVDEKWLRKEMWGEGPWQAEEDYKAGRVKSLSKIKKELGL